MTVQFNSDLPFTKWPGWRPVDDDTPYGVAMMVVVRFDDGGDEVCLLVAGRCEYCGWVSPAMYWPARVIAWLVPGRRRAFSIDNALARQRWHDNGAPRGGLPPPEVDDEYVLHDLMAFTRPARRRLNPAPLPDARPRRARRPY